MERALAHILFMLFIYYACTSSTESGGGITSSGCPSVCFTYVRPYKRTNVHSDLRMNGLDFGTRWSTFKVTAASRGLTCERETSSDHAWKDFCKLGTNLHLVSRVKWLNIGGLCHLTYFEAPSVKVVLETTTLSVPSQTGLMCYIWIRSNGHHGSHLMAVLLVSAYSRCLH